MNEATPGSTRATEPSAQSPGPLMPVALEERLGSLDLLRGVALLGILMVNMPLFALPLMIGFGSPALVDGPAADRVGWWIVFVGFQWSFISLFSLLFGAGFAVMHERAAARGRSLVGPYLRRSALLMIFGTLHVVLLWMGDILFAYGVLALPLLALGWLKPKALAIIGVAAVLFGVVATSGSTALQGFAEQITTEAAVAERADVATSRPSTDQSPIDEVPIEGAHDLEALEIDEVAVEPPRGLDAMIESHFNPASPIWIDAEAAAHIEGPYLTAMLFRVVIWIFALVSAVFSFGWHVVGFFFIGASLLRSGFFSASAGGTGAPWMRWQYLMVGAIPLGLLLKVTYAGLMQANGWQITVGIGLLSGVQMIGAAMVTIGLAAAGCIVVRRGIAAAPVRWIMQTGRMPLTLYLMQSVIAVAIMDHWGLGKFGTFDRITLIGLTLAIWIGQVIFANVWFRTFEMGPLEWLWRLGTYLKPATLRRSRSSRVDGDRS